MAATANFRDLLGAKASQIEKPKPTPPGTYNAVINGWEPVESSQKKTPGVKITFNLRAPLDDVDTDALEAFGGVNEIQKRRVSTTFWITDDSTYRLKEFLEGPCKIEGGDRSLSEMLAEIRGAAVNVVLVHRMNQKNEVFTEVEEVLAEG